MLVDMASCTDNNQILQIGPLLELEHNVDVDGNVLLTTAPARRRRRDPARRHHPGGRWRRSRLADQPTLRGIRAAGNTPIAQHAPRLQGDLLGRRRRGDGANLWFTGRANVTAISTQTPVKQRTFAIVVTDGDDTCATIDGRRRRRHERQRCAARRARGAAALPADRLDRSGLGRAQLHRRLRQRRHARPRELGCLRRIRDGAQHGGLRRRRALGHGADRHGRRCVQHLPACLHRRGPGSAGRGAQGRDQPGRGLRRVLGLRPRSSARCSS